MKNWGLFTSVIGFAKHLPLVSNLAISRVTIFIVGALIGVMLYFSGIFLVVPNLIKIIWPWKFQNIFVHAVNQPYLVQEITWMTVIKFSIFLFVLWIIYKGVQPTYTK
jgi:hypothetical protein